MKDYYHTQPVPDLTASEECVVERVGAGLRMLETTGLNKIHARSRA